VMISSPALHEVSAQLHSSIPFAFEEAYRLIVELDRLDAHLQSLQNRLGVFESSAPRSFSPALQISIERLTDEVREIFIEICDRYETYCVEGERIADLVFRALVEIRGRQERLSRSAIGHSGPALSAAAGGLLFKLKRALAVVRGALCADAGVESIHRVRI
jgi:hypothetical protein